jgi:hypothetical protein
MNGHRFLSAQRRGGQRRIRSRFRDGDRVRLLNAYQTASTENRVAAPRIILPERLFDVVAEAL